MIHNLGQWVSAAMNRIQGFQNEQSMSEFKEAESQGCDETAVSN